MVVDNLIYAKQYYGLGVRIEKALKYLESTDLLQLEIGKHEIEGNNIFAIVSEYKTKNIEQVKWEAHKEYLDIQYVIKGKERIGYSSINEMEVMVEYNEEKDILFVEGQGDFVTVNEGTFIIFAPNDVHMPGVCFEKPLHVKKVVIKVLMK